MKYTKADMKKKSASTKPAISNRRARFDYELGETISAGLMLSGAEVRGARLGHVRITGAYANLKGGELWLTNMSISIPDTAREPDEDKERSHPRKLLVTKKQLADITAAKTQGMTIVPTRLFTHGKFIKIELSLAKGKKHHDKRETIKRRQQDRDTQRELKR